MGLRSITDSPNWCLTYFKKEEAFIQILMPGDTCWLGYPNASPVSFQQGFVKEKDTNLQFVLVIAGESPPTKSAFVYRNGNSTKIKINLYQSITIGGLILLSASLKHRKFKLLNRKFAIMLVITSFSRFICLTNKSVVSSVIGY